MLPTLTPTLKHDALTKQLTNTTTPTRPFRRPTDSFYEKGVHPEVAKLRASTYEDQRVGYLMRCKQHWVESIAEAATEHIKSPPGTTAFNMYKAANNRLNHGAKKRAKMLRDYQVMGSWRP